MSVRISITAVDRLGRRVAESKLNSVSETRNRVDTITIDRRRRRDRYCLMPQGGSTHAQGSCKVTTAPSLVGKFCLTAQHARTCNALVPNPGVNYQNRLMGPIDLGNGLFF